MSSFKKQFIFILLAGVILTASGLIIKGATPSGKLKIKSSLTAKVKMVNQQNATSTSNNPVGWWKMDEGTAIHGSTLADSSGNGNTGTLSTGDGSTNKSVAGKLGKGLSFDGVNDWVDAGNATSLQNLSNAGQNVTFSLWVKTSDANGTLIAKYFPFQIRISESKLLAYIYNGSVFVVNGQLGSSNIDNNVWHHVVWTINRAGNSTLYIDGSIDGTPVDISTYSSEIWSKTDSFFIGRRLTTDTDPYFLLNGSIDDVRIYNRALSAGEVAQMFNSTKDGYLGNIKVSTGLVGYWKLDDNNALTSVIDYSGKGNTGTAYSGTATSTSMLSTSTAMIGRAMSFDGVDDWVDAGTPSTLNLSNIITYEAWVYPLAYSTISTKFITGNCYYSGSWKGGWCVGMYGAATPYWWGLVSTQAGGTLSTGSNSQTPVVLNQWVHVAYVYDNASAKIYINGVLKDTDNEANNFQVPTISNNTVIAKGPYDSRFTNAIIDEVKIWNYARSAEQIRNDYMIGLKHQEE